MKKLSKKRLRKILGGNVPYPTGGSSSGSKKVQTDSKSTVGGGGISGSTGDEAGNNGGNGAGYVGSDGTSPSITFD